MIYSVKANFTKDKLKDFFALLTSGELEKAHPAGVEIQKSMLEMPASYLP